MKTILLFLLRLGILLGLLALLGCRATKLMSAEEQGRKDAADIIASQKGMPGGVHGEVVRMRQAIVLNDAKLIGLALTMYAQDNDSVLPPADHLSKYLAPYLHDKNMNVFDPVDNDTNKTPVHQVIKGKSLKQIPKPGETIIAYKTGTDCRANIYADGHAKMQP